MKEEDQQKVEQEIRRDRICGKCGSRLFLADETTTHLVINGEVVKSFPDGQLHGFTCLKCSDPELYEDFKIYEPDE